MPNIPSNYSADTDEVFRRAAEIAAPVFEREGWTYFWSDTPPAAVDLELTLHSLLPYMLEAEDHHSTATGRFKLRKLGGGNIEVSLILGTIVRGK